MEQTRSHSPWLIAALVAICLLPLVLPGDAPWINDEPQLLALAQHNNITPGHFLGIPIPFTIGKRGLQGNRGAIYGPIAVWFYQVMIAVLPHDLVLLTAARTAAVTLVTAAALAWLSRSTGLRFGFAPVLMLSPWIYFYSRQMWDNSFLIPLSAMLLASYVGFLKTRSPWAFSIAALCSLLMPLIHLMALAMVVPVLLHLLLFEWRWILRFKFYLLVIGFVLGIFILPYIALFYSTYEHVPPIDSSPWQGFAFPLLGAHHLSALGIGELYGEDWIYNSRMPWPFVMTACVWITGLAYIAAWIGMILAVPSAWRICRQFGKGSIKDHLATLALAIWFCQTLLDGIERTYSFAHYYNATWIAYAIFTWVTVDALPRAGVARLALAAYAMSLLAAILFALTQIHINGGARNREYGPTIANQQAVTDEISTYPAESLRDPQFPNWADFPIALQTIHFLRPPAQEPTGPPKHLVIRYRNLFPQDARIVVDVYDMPATQPATRESQGSNR
jgi:hypothetical protein